MLDPNPLASSKGQDGLSSANSAEETCRLVEHYEGEAMKPRGLIHSTILSVALLTGCGDGGTAPLNDSITETKLSSDLHDVRGTRQLGDLHLVSGGRSVGAYSAFSGFRPERF